MSTLFVDTLEPNQNTAIDVAAGKFKAVGSVVQFVRNSVTSNITTTSSSYVASGLSVTITPKFSTSKLLVKIEGGRPSIQASGRQMDLKLYEGTNPVDSFRLGSMYQNVGVVYYNGSNYTSYLDATNTNSRTYNLYWKSSIGSLTVHLSDSTDIETSMSVMEVAQ